MTATSSPPRTDTAAVRFLGPNVAGKSNTIRVFLALLRADSGEVRLPAGVAAVGVALRRPGIGWLAVTFVVAALYLGAPLRLPSWLIDASPVGRTTAPSSVSVPALCVMVGVAVGLTLMAGWLYRRRDAAYR